MACPKCGSNDYRSEQIKRLNSCNSKYETIQIYNKCNACQHQWDTPTQG